MIYLMTFALAFFLSGLIHEMWQRYDAGWFRARKAEKNSRGKADWELLAEAYENAALEEIRKSEGASEYFPADENLRRAAKYFDEARQLKEKALQEMMEGKIL